VPTADLHRERSSGLAVPPRLGPPALAGALAALAVALLVIRRRRSRSRWR
jgi:hypothetical protein